MTRPPGSFFFLWNQSGQKMVYKQWNASQRVRSRRKTTDTRASEQPKCRSLDGEATECRLWKHCGENWPETGSQLCVALAVHLSVTDRCVDVFVPIKRCLNFCFHWAVFYKLYANTYVDSPFTAIFRYSYMPLAIMRLFEQLTHSITLFQLLSTLSTSNPGHLWAWWIVSPLCLRIARSLTKEHPWVEHLTSPSNRGWVLFWVLSHLTTKQHPWSWTDR